MTRFVPPAFALVSVLALSACGGGSVSLTNATPEEVAKVATANGVSQTMRPGMWETTVDLIELDVPGMPPELKAQALEKARAEKKVSKYCLSEEEAKKPGGMFTGTQENNCTYRKFEMDGGKVDMIMVCPARDGSEMTMSVKGNFTAESATAVTEMNSTGQFGMKMKANMTTRRTGDCTPEAKK